MRWAMRAATMNWPHFLLLLLVINGTILVGLLLVARGRAAAKNILRYKSR